VHEQNDHSIDRLISDIDAFHGLISAAQRGLFRLIADGDTRGAWRADGARDMAHWLSMRQGISEWKARRWVAAAHALERLPRLSEAFTGGSLGIDKVVELARFATPEDEAGLIAWARGVSCARVRRRADVACRQSIDDVREAEKSRFLSWWYFDDGRRFGLEAELPASQGAIVAKALGRLGDELPVMPGEEDACHADARRADALVTLCSGRIADDLDPDRATIVVHAQLDGLVSGEGACELEGGGLIHAETARRLLCNARAQTVVEDVAGDAVSFGRLSREPSAAMMRQLRHRDRECVFPACGARRFVEAHHVVWWRNGGRTDLDNLALICSFHHKLVHEHGWSVSRDRGEGVRWFRPDGHPYHPGPDPPGVIAGRQAHLAVAL
jgi:hypothetical protein